MLNYLILSSGVLAAVTATVHIIVGGKEVTRPLLASAVDYVVKLTMYACWHLVSVALVLSALALLAVGAGLVNAPALVAFVSALWILFGAVFLVVTLVVAQPRGLLRLPQWVLLLPVGVLGLWGLA
ncbi:MAG: hypothetical protein MUD01_05140 [Chloroflexaceae bacterium]|nr:hypothetical protein [Chloroflexaceae bacterium]